mmetsp:Transcript_96075/g.268936  ORF Transcript_96075/g.268936 Transcript_96075/m.268936 type:complete len:208 (+) Transcript_96075:454-1077(+)
MRTLLRSRLRRAIYVPHGDLYQERQDDGECELLAMPAGHGMPRGFVRSAHLRELSCGEIQQRKRHLGDCCARRKLWRRRLPLAGRRMPGLPAVVFLPHGERCADLLPARNLLSGRGDRGAGVRGLSARAQLPAPCERFYCAVVGAPGWQRRGRGWLGGACRLRRGRHYDPPLLRGRGVCRGLPLQSHASELLPCRRRRPAAGPEPRR